MPNRHNGNSTSAEKRTRQQVRAERILDAAATLIQRWGYNKTTIDDIAKQAGVAKGTIYLHWKTKEDLFVALLTREELKLVEDIKQRVANDPEGSTLRGFIKHTTLAVMKNPLMKATLLNDTDTLGVWANREYNSTTYAGRIANYKHFLEFLRNYGIIGTDLDIREQTYILSAIWMGFFLIDRWMPEEFQLPEKDAVELLADTVQRALAPNHTSSGHKIDTQQEVANALNQYMDQEINALKEMQKEAEV